MENPPMPKIRKPLLTRIVGVASEAKRFASNIVVSGKYWINASNIETNQAPLCRQCLQLSLTQKNICILLIQQLSILFIIYFLFIQS